MLRASCFWYLPEACNPRLHRSVALVEADRARLGCDLMLAGSNYYYRQDILASLGEFDLRFWGSTPHWLVDRLGARNQHASVFGEDKAVAVAAARICLNTLHYSEVNGLNCRTFEVAGCGGFQLVTDVPVLREHFVPGEEIVAFSSADDLCDKVRYYLVHPDEAQAIARRGQARAHREHTYEARLLEILARALPGTLPGPPAAAISLVDASNPS
jgi:spore maturation protein CgeB